MLPERQAGFRRARRAAAEGAGDHLRRPSRSPDGARRRRRRDGRLQHVLRDPVVRQAGADRAAHGAAPRAVHPRPARRRARPRRDAVRRQTRATREAWRRRCCSCRSRRRPRRSSSRGCSTAWRTSTGWPRNGSTAAARQRFGAPGAAQRMTRRTSRTPGGRVAFVLKGYPRLSETFIAQEIAGAGAARARHPDRLAAPADRPGDPSGPSPDPRAGRLYLPEYLHQEPRRVLARLARGAAPARLSRGPARLARRSAPRPDARTASAALARRWCWRPSCRPMSADCTRISCTRRPRWRATPR